ncbi:Plastin-3 [Desmophyllum pertusum]|uniref:Plastin-3 n=1 Tax=Desmophyllum pertusum TaxID=174260 RepID=A0A9X0D9Y3_9CNID|nr:Plastin-3 [Desmophyllum pertusum]
MADSDIPKDRLAELEVCYKEYDLDGNGRLKLEELGDLMKDLGEEMPSYKLREIAEEFDTNKNGIIEFNEFLEIYKKHSKKFLDNGMLKKQLKKPKQKVQSSGGTSESSSTDTKHSYSEEERVAFVNWINTALQEDADVKAYLPIDPATSEIFEKIRKDGIILCKMINLSVADTIDERAINKPESGKS